MPGVLWSNEVVLFRIDRVHLYDHDLNTIHGKRESSDVDVSGLILDMI